MHAAECGRPTDSSTHARTHAQKATSCAQQQEQATKRMHDVHTHLLVLTIYVPTCIICQHLTFYM